MTDPTKKKRTFFLLRALHMFLSLCVRMRHVSKRALLVTAGISAVLVGAVWLLVIFDKKTITCPDGARAIKGTYRVDVMSAPFRVGPDDNTARVINRKASDAMRTTRFIDLAFGYELEGFCQKNGWLYGRILRINGMQASEAASGWVEKKFTSLVKAETAPTAEETESPAPPEDPTRPYPLLSSKMKCRSTVTETLNLATPPSLNAMTRQDNNDGSRLFFVTVDRGKGPTERVRCLVAPSGEAVVEE